MKKLMGLPDETRRRMEECDELIQQKLVLHKQLRVAIDRKDFNKIVELMAENAVEDVQFIEMYARNIGVAERPSDINMEGVRKCLIWACNEFEIKSV